MKHQALFSSKDISKKLKCHLLQFLFGALRVKVFTIKFCYVMRKVLTGKLSCPVLGLVKYNFKCNLVYQNIEIIEFDFGIGSKLLTF